MKTFNNLGLTAALLDVQDLVNLNSLGTLLSYTIVAHCIIMLRYVNEQMSFFLRFSLFVFLKLYPRDIEIYYEILNDSPHADILI